MLPLRTLRNSIGEIRMLTQEVELADTAHGS